MGLLDNLLRDEPPEERCTCCICDIGTNSGCPHGRSRLRLPGCETCPVKDINAEQNRGGP